MLYWQCCTGNIVQGLVVQECVVREMLYRKYCTGKYGLEKTVQGNDVQNMLYRKDYRMTCCTTKVLY